MPLAVGMDIGGVNIKATLVETAGDQLIRHRVFYHPLEIWRDPQSIRGIFQQIAREWGEGLPLAVTMTAELSDAFRTKREGVHFILDCVQQAFPASPVRILDVNGHLIGLREARVSPLRVAAANWVATAALAGRFYPYSLLVDVGSTTTDIIPIIDRHPASLGKTDLDRLQAGELVYTGVLRSNINTIACRIPVKGQLASTAAECFAISADVHLLLDHISPDEYTCPAPDGRSKTKEGAAVRLARVVCADPEILSLDHVTQIARYIYEKQLQRISEGILQVLSRTACDPKPVLVAAGLGAFMAAACGQRLGLEVRQLARHCSQEAAVAAPSFALAYLLASEGGRQ